MADRTLQIILNAKDNVSAVFAKVGNSAKTLGDSLESTSGAPLDNASSSAESLESALDGAGTAAGNLEGALNGASSATDGLSGAGDSASGLESSLDGAGSAAVDMGDGLQDAGDKGSAALDSAAKSARDLESAMSSVGGTLTIAGGAITTMFAAPMALGTKAAWDQVQAVENATLALRAYETDVGKVNKALADMLAFARSDQGRLFMRQELFAAAQQLKVAGAETENLAEYVEIMSRSVATGMGNWDELSRVITRVGQTSRLTSIDFEMLQKMGFQLDDSIRDTTVTWDELFTILDEGSVRVQGATETIDGQMMMLSTSVRGLGLAFLQVDSETSQFVEGGLGSRLYGAIGTATELMNSARPAAEALGQTFAIAAEGAGVLVSAFQLLPDGIQATIVSMTALTGVGMSAAGMILVTLPRVMEFRRELEVLGGARGLLSTVARSGPVTFGAIGIAALVATGAIAGMYQRTQDMVTAATNLNDIWKDLMLTGDTGMADDLEKVRGEIGGLIDDLEAGDLPDWLPIKTGDVVPADVKEGITSNLSEAITDSRVDADAFFTWIHEEMAKLETDQEKRDFLVNLADPNILIDFTTAANDAGGALDGLGDSAENAAASASDLLGIFSDLPSSLDDLRLSGDWEVADQIESMSKNILGTFSSQEFMGLGAPASAGFSGLIEVMNLTETEIESLDTAWNRSMNAMSEGTIDNARYMEDWNAILADSTLTDAEKVESLTHLSLSTHEYRDSNKAMMEDQIDFLSQGENILDWWREYDRLLNQGAASFDGTAQQMAEYEAMLADQDAFRGMVDWASDINDASRALDQALRTFQQIDDLGSRSSAAGTIAENLVGEPGVWHEIDQMLADGKISLEEYNEAVTAGHGIQESNLRTQELLNEVRRDQLPLLHEEQLAYEQNLEYLTTLNAEEQRRALMLQDTSVQTEIAAAYSLAYSAAMGEIPEEVATEMLINTAQADPAMADLLVKFGLLNEEIGPDGVKTYSVNFPDADTTVDSINRLTIAFLEFEAAARGISGFELAIELYGEEDAMALYGMVKDADGTYSKMTLEADTSEAEGNITRTQREVDSYNGSSATALLNADGSQATGEIGMVDESLGALDGSTAYVDINARDNASGVIAEVASNWGGTIATSFIDIVPRNIPGNAHGGLIQEYASGGVLFRGGELGPEVAHFATGGTALLPGDGYYTAPAGTYISPNNAVSNSYGGIDLGGIHIHGNVFGMGDLTERVAEELVPALSDVLDEHYRSAGL